ncbi:nucleolysin TIAR-like [Andrena cerasifolii]|uniref:nucleolysin TIAR-like n=1 Tax=Andrena cerasifolii TaxID=2819439 RepID=UPI004037A88A
MADSTAQKTLYVGNLDQSVSEDLLCALFSHIGVIRGCKIIRERHRRGHAFGETRASIAGRMRRETNRFGA